MSEEVLFTTIFVIFFFCILVCTLFHRQRQRIAVQHVMQNRRVTHPRQIPVTDGIAVAVIVPDENMSAVSTTGVSGIVV